MADVQRIIDRIMNGSRIQASSHFSHRVYSDEPILTTGSQMASYLPDKYREMRAISRWQEGQQGERGRWLSEAELFYRQGKFMEDFEDNCPYRGTFKSYYPTYNAMSDRQLRGYFTWRSEVRAGNVRETSLSFAYVYLYELICGIGVSSPQDGYDKLYAFWQAYRAYAPEIDRNVRVWLQDYVVYHNLDASLIQEQSSLQLTRKIMELTDATSAALAWAEEHGWRRRGKLSRLPLPANDALEDRLIAAIDSLATHRIASSRFYREEPHGLRHVACAVYLRMCDHFAKQHEGGLIECFFGSVATLPYAMFAAAIFFEPVRHPDCTYVLNDLRTFCCSHGLWSYTGLHENGSGGKRLGLITRGTDRLMRQAYGFAHPLQEHDLPKYLTKHIEREIDIWRTWEAEHAPITIDIDLSKLAGIRSNAAATREALLIDEEREEGSVETPVAAGEGKPQPAARIAKNADNGKNAAPDAHDAPRNRTDAAACTENATDTKTDTASCAVAHACDRADDAAGGAPSPQKPALSLPQALYVQALLADDVQQRQHALTAAGVSEDLLVDSINEMLFEQLGDTAIEFDADGATIVEDYRDEIEGIVTHAL